MHWLLNEWLNYVDRERLFLFSKIAFCIHFENIVLSNIYIQPDRLDCNLSFCFYLNVFMIIDVYNLSEFNLLTKQNERFISSTIKLYNYVYFFLFSPKKYQTIRADNSTSQVSQQSNDFDKNTGIKCGPSLKTSM